MPAPINSNTFRYVIAFPTSDLKSPHIVATMIDPRTVVNLDVPLYERTQTIPLGRFSEIRVIRGGIDHCCARESSKESATGILLDEVNKLMQTIAPAMPTGCANATFSIGTERLPSEFIPFILEIQDSLKDSFPMYDCVNCHLGPPTMMMVQGCEFVLGHGDLYIVVNPENVGEQ